VLIPGFKPWLSQIKDHEVGICCFYFKHAAYRSKSKDWMALNQDNVSNWSNMPLMQASNSCLVGLVGFMMFNATFNNISVISWQSVLLVEKTPDLVRYR
jgi:hypothetical protein